MLLAVIVLVVLLIGLTWWNFLANRQSGIPQIEIPISPEPENKSVEDEPLAASLVKNLDTPWALDFLPDGSIIFTERDGRIRLIVFV